MNKIKLREDLDVSLIEEFGSKLIYISDPLLIAEPIGLPFSYYPFIQLLMEGKMTASEIASDSASKVINLSEEKVYILLSNMDELSLLENDRTRVAIEYMGSYLSGNVRHSYCHKFSYPENPNELDTFLDKILSKSTIEAESKIRGIMAPHIDLRIEESWSIYANSFLHLKNLEGVDTVVLLGTAHYRSTADFMYTKKDFSTPYGLVKNDLELLEAVQENALIKFDDISHFKEHSLEFHLLFLQKLLPNKNFKILPILTGSPANYLDDKGVPIEYEEYENQVQALKKAIVKLGRKVLILASGDMSHIGRKFGDDFSAGSQLIRIKAEDEVIIRSLESGRKDNFFNEIITMDDKNRICGISPFYAALSLLDLTKVKNVGYNLWNEEDTESLVSFAGFLLK